MEYIELPDYLQNTLTMDTNLVIEDIYCEEPTIIEGLVEGSTVVIVNTGSMPDGTVIQLTTGDVGYSNVGIAIIKLQYPLKENQTVGAKIEADNCIVSSCVESVKGLSSEKDSCLPRVFPKANVLTGRMLCDGKEFYKQAHDGLGGFKKGVVLFADCIWCGGLNPNCDE